MKTSPTGRHPATCLVILLLMACPSPESKRTPNHSAATKTARVDWGYPSPRPAPTQAEVGTWPEVVVHTQSGYELVKVSAGRSPMGSPDDEPGHTPAESPVHFVELGAYYIGRREVTNAEYRRYLDATGAVAPSHWSDVVTVADDQPVTGISWKEAQAWVDWASLRLPTEAQWEHAARAGSRGRFAFGEDDASLSVYAWCDDEQLGAGPQPVGGKQANAWGIYDAHGNVWEWVADRFVDYTRPTRSHDGLRDGTGEVLRTIRGGSWKTPARICRSASRSAMDPEERNGGLGFRAAAVGPPQP